MVEARRTFVLIVGMHANHQRRGASERAEELEEELEEYPEADEEPVARTS
jgi:hypothetical protein